ncbi:hypothetical protein KEC54_20775 [Methylorubrum extorquens]|uniref:Uncharacterized protein n=1 Tax=Methylorubrum extorquens TaxID=408 RepID=A0AAX3WE70_METEX|nr:hypothetical protein KEC54_20775 [Methylorubrum extorquens]
MVALVLQAFGADQPIKMNHGGAHHDADGGRRLAHGVEEGGAGILYQLPAVGDPDGLERRPRRGLAIRQESDDASPFQIAD